MRALWWGVAPGWCSAGAAATAAALVMGAPVHLVHKSAARSPELGDKPMQGPPSSAPWSLGISCSSPPSRARLHRPREPAIAAVAAAVKAQAERVGGKVKVTAFEPLGAPAAAAGSGYDLLVFPAGGWRPRQGFFSVICLGTDL